MNRRDVGVRRDVERPTLQFLRGTPVLRFAVFATGQPRARKVPRFSVHPIGPLFAIRGRMGRRGRLQFPGAVYHVMARGNRKAMIVDDDDDRWTFMRTFGEAATDYGVRVYACSLMGTHYHALLDTPRRNLSEFVRSLNTGYSKAFNRRHARVGHTFEQRFVSLVVQREKYLRRVARYIALNPVEAQLCSDPADWPWSTYRATAGLEEAAAWLHLNWLLWAFRADSLSDAQCRYAAYTRDPAGLTWSFDMAPALGTARFKKAVAESVRTCGENRPVPGDCLRWTQPSLGDLFSREEGHPCSRDGLIFVAHVTHGFRLVEIANFLSLKPSTVSKALSRARRSRALIAPI